MSFWVPEEFKEKQHEEFKGKKGWDFFLFFFRGNGGKSTNVVRVHVLNSGKGRHNKPKMGYNWSVNHAIGLEIRETDDGFLHFRLR